MDMKIKKKFIRHWKKYFNDAELPTTFYYTNEAQGAEVVKPSSGHRCIFADLCKVRTGKSLYFDAESIGCFGGKSYLGFGTEVMENFEYFLSCGIPGKLEGERYKKTPELVKEIMENIPKFKTPDRFIVFKRWDMLEEPDEPHVVIFFARPDVLSGLFTLANFDRCEPNGVFTHSDHPRGVLGMFDVSARPFIPQDILSFSVPMNRFVEMIGNMEESFLITPSWAKIKKRIKTAKP